MSRMPSPSSGKAYGLARVCRIWRSARASIYRHRHPESARRRPGPAGPMPDAALLERIRDVLSGSPFHGEGHRKVWARLRTGGIRTRLAPGAAAHARERPVGSRACRQLRGPRNHDGTIIPDTIDTMWGTDMTTTWTAEGQVAVFIAVDHYSAGCVGIYAARRGTRFEALEPLRQCVRRHIGAIGKAIARGLSVRHDHGLQYMFDTFQTEMCFLGIQSSPAFVWAPEGKGCAERFIRTLKEKLLWIQTFDTVKELRLALLAFRDVYNTTWLIQRLDYRTPAQVRQQLSADVVAA